MSTFSILLLVFFCIIVTTSSTLHKSDSSKAFMEEFFKSVQKAIDSNDTKALNKFIDPHFGMAVYYGKNCKFVGMGKDDFIGNVTTSSQFSMNILWSEYCDEKNPSIDCIRMRLMINGFENQFDMQSWFEYPYWGGGEAGRCNYKE